jgi:hypothetical protein
VTATAVKEWVGNSIFVLISSKVWTVLGYSGLLWVADSQLRGDPGKVEAIASALRRLLELGFCWPD